MGETITPPDPQVLIPPILAMLPTSFASSKPPPALIPLLTPILQQRVQIHTSTPGSEHESWLRLLCWDAAKAEVVKETIENANFEPHPSSGEIEVGEVEPTGYKRFDSETLRARLSLSDWDLTMVFLWRSGGEESGTWQLAELLPLEHNSSKDASWSDSLDKVAVSTSLSPPAQLERKQSAQGEDEDYWAMYDNNTPGRTPARLGSVNPMNQSDEEYYARYGDVQPAMDNHDPDEEHEVGQTSLGGTILQQLVKQPREGSKEQLRPPEDDDVVHVNHPVPSSPSSKAGSDTVAKLEDSAEKYTASDIAIHQHISTSMKSMYRLAKASGISRDDFDQMVQRELEALSILDADD